MQKNTRIGRGAPTAGAPAMVQMAQWLIRPYIAPISFGYRLWSSQRKNNMRQGLLRNIDFFLANPPDGYCPLKKCTNPPLYASTNVYVLSMHTRTNAYVDVYACMEQVVAYMARLEISLVLGSVRVTFHGISDPSAKLDYSRRVWCKD